MKLKEEVCRSCNKEEERERERKKEREREIIMQDQNSSDFYLRNFFSMIKKNKRVL
jgi:hypothetical protein